MMMMLIMMMMFLLYRSKSLVGDRSSGCRTASVPDRDPSSWGTVQSVAEGASSWDVLWSGRCQQTHQQRKFVASERGRQRLQWVTVHSFVTVHSNVESS